MKNMTTGAPLGLLFPFMVPLLIGNVFQQLYNISDIIIVGRMLGVEALAAVGAASPLFFLTIFVTFGLASGFSVITGQRFGAKDMEGMRRSVGTCITLSIICVLLIMLIFNLTIDPIMLWMNVPRELVSMAKAYTMIIVNGLWSMMAYNLLASIMRALGDSRTPLYALILSTLINIALAILFVGPCGWGVPGTAYALVIAQACSAFFCGIYVFIKNKELHLHSQDFTLHPTELWEHFRMGLPMAVHFSVLGLGIIILQAVANGFGADTIAGFTTAIRVEQLATQPLVSAGLAMAVFTAQNYGARRFDRIREAVKKMSFCSIGYALGATCLIYFCGESIVRLFLDNPNKDVMSAAHMYFIFSLPFYFALGEIFLFRNTLQGMGLSMLPMLGAFVELLARCGGAIFLAPHLGFMGVCLAEPISWGSCCTLFAGAYFYFIRILERTKK